MAMVQAGKTEAIQAFPMGMHTTSAILTDFDRNGYHVIHCIGDTLVTVSDGTSTNAITFSAGMDMALTPDIQTVSTDVEVMIG